MLFTLTYIFSAYHLTHGYFELKLDKEKIKKRLVNLVRVKIFCVAELKALSPKASTLDGRLHWLSILAEFLFVRIFGF